MALVSVCVVHGAASLDALDGRRAGFERAFADGVPVVLEGRVCSFPHSGPYGTTFAFETKPTVTGQALKIRVRAVRFDIDYGDSLRLHARDVRLRGPVDRLYADGVVGVVRCAAGDVECLAAGAATPRRLAWRMHRAARLRLARALGSRSALPIALLLGEREALTPASREAFARAGIAHLLALSGMHLGLVAGMVWFVLRRAGGRRAGWLLAAALAAYVGVVGGAHSLRRALVMAFVLLGAKGMERPADGVAALARALVVLLCADPASLYSAGFQLSFVATLGVLTALGALPRFDRRGRRRRLRSDAIATLTAGAAALVIAAPLQLHYFGRLTPTGPLVTVAFIPAVAVLLCAAALAVAVAPVPVLGAGGMTVLGWCAEAVGHAAALVARHGPGPIAPPVPDVAVYAAGIAVTIAGRRSRSALAVGLALVGASFAKSCGH